MAGIDWSVSDGWSPTAADKKKTAAPKFTGFAEKVHGLIGAGLIFGIALLTAACALGAIVIGRSVAGSPMTFQVSENWVHFPPGEYEALPLTVQLIVFAVSLSIACALARAFSKPSGEFKTYGKNAWWKALIALAIVPVGMMGVNIGAVFLIDTVLTTSFPGVVGLLYPDEPLRLTIT